MASTLFFAAHLMSIPQKGRDRSQTTAWKWGKKSQKDLWEARLLWTQASSAWFPWHPVPQLPEVGAEEEHGQGAFSHLSSLPVKPALSGRCAGVSFPFLKLALFCFSNISSALSAYFFICLSMWNDFSNDYGQNRCLLWWKSEYVAPLASEAKVVLLMVFLCSVLCKTLVWSLEQKIFQERAYRWRTDPAPIYFLPYESSRPTPD